MHYFKITTHTKHDTLFEGRFKDFKSCLEHAVDDGVKLNHADLTRQNLSGADLDGATFEGADFSYSNLNGANIAEANLKGARLCYSDLYNTCFAESDLQYSMFDHAQFGGTLIYDADLSFSRFSDQSCFSLNFTEARTLEGCMYVLSDKRVTTMGNPPVVISGLRPQPIVFLDEFILTGDGTYPRSQWLAVFESGKTIS